MDIEQKSKHKYMILQDQGEECESSVQRPASLAYASEPTDWTDDRRRSTWS